MFKSSEGSTKRLIELCAGYFFFYIITGVAVKYFTGKTELGFLGMTQISYTTYNTIGGVLTCLAVVFYAGWHRFKSQNLTTVAGINIPAEFLYIIPSGICTAVVIVNTTLIYTLFPTVMVAMVVMRASVIVISRIVDSVQITQGILKKKVYREENIAVIIAIGVVAVQVTFAKSEGNVFENPFGLGVLLTYLLAYLFRIYIMNYYKNTRPAGTKQNNEGFFAIEQIAATMTMVFFAAGLFLFGDGVKMIMDFRNAIISPPEFSLGAALIGIAYGCVAFFSVFIFMFKGRTATFAGLVNRFTSLIAGTVATLIMWLVFNGTQPKPEEWVSLVLILIAVGFLSAAEKKRTAELAAMKEI